jgi:plasmid stabilization system protein ParE
MHLAVHPAARLELERALDWVRGEFGPAVAARLRRRVDEAGRLILREPNLGTPAAAGARKFPLGSFPYTLVYRVEGESVHVVAFMHQSRMPEYWAGRS